jgi:hypothetical protein
MTAYLDYLLFIKDQWHNYHGNNYWSHVRVTRDMPYPNAKNGTFFPSWRFAVHNECTAQICTV